MIRPFSSRIIQARWQSVRLYTTSSALRQSWQPTITPKPYTSSSKPSAVPYSSSAPPATLKPTQLPPSDTRPGPIPTIVTSVPSLPSLSFLNDTSSNDANATESQPQSQEHGVDWSRSFSGLSTTPFSTEASKILMEPVAPTDVEVKPDGIVYLPEIKYRRILNRAFGPGAWGLAPREEMVVTPKNVSREYGLIVHGRLVSIARGEQQYFDPEGISTATEGCKSNALMRCCKDLGIASELWDPVFIRNFMAKHAKEVWCEHVTTKKKKKIYMRKDVATVAYPYKESKF